MVECLAIARISALLAALLANPPAEPWWMDALGRAELVIAAADLIFLLAVWVILVLLWLRMDRLVAWIKLQAQPSEETPQEQRHTSPPLPLASDRDEEHDRLMTQIDAHLLETTAMVREFMDVLQKIRANQAAALPPQDAHPSPPEHSLHGESAQQPPSATSPTSFEDNYNAIFSNPSRDERVLGVKEQFRVNFRDKGSADRNPDASSPLVRDSSGWLSVFVEEGTGVLYLAPSLAFRAGTLMNTHVSKLSSLFTFPSTPVTRLERAATVHRVGDEFHLDRMGSMS